MDVNGIGHALEALNLQGNGAQDETRNIGQPPGIVTAASSATNRQPGSHQISHPPGSRHLDSTSQVDGDVSDHDARRSLLSLPTELLEIIVTFLLDTHNFRSAASLNRTCKSMYTVTLSKLWTTVFWRWQGRSAAFAESNEWYHMTHSRGFKFTRFLTIQTDLKRAAFKGIESHLVMRNVHAILLSPPVKSYRRNDNTMSEVESEAKFDNREISVRLTDQYSYATSDLLHLISAVGRGRCLEMTVVPSTAIPTDLDPYSALSSFRVPLLPSQSSTPLVHLARVNLDLRHSPRSAEIYRNIAPHAVAEMLRLMAYSDENLKVHVVGLEEEDKVRVLSAVKDLDARRRLVT